MKMKNYIILAVLMVFGLNMMAQGQREDKRAQIESKRAAFITERAELNTKEAEAYWPLANELRAKKQALVGDIKGKLKDLDMEKATEAEVEKLLRAKATHRVEAEKLDLAYLDKFIQVLGAKKVALVEKAEKEFRREMLMEFRDAPRPDRPERPERPQGNTPK
jgi:predicted transcriptional regulator